MKLPRRRLTPFQRALLLAWHAARGFLVRSEASKLYHFAKAAYHGKRLAEKELERQRRAERLGLTKKQYGILVVLSNGQTYTVKQLAEKLDASEGTIRKHLNKLVDEGIVERDTSSRPYLYRLSRKILELVEED
ncbi:MAG TPA: ArsR family transcriptional regulator [Candidatus Korarchaeota archaeon]|nr:ArsR family transcriptional regulator [Candidatus Korarchaeota archaeon]